MALHQTMRELLENGASITATSDLVHRLGLDNPALINDTNLNDVQMRINAGNMEGYAAGHLNANKVLNADGEVVTREEKEAEDRRRAAQISNSFAMADMIEQTFDDHLGFDFSAWNNRAPDDVINDRERVMVVDSLTVQRNSFIAASAAAKVRIDERNQEITALQEQVVTAEETQVLNQEAVDQAETDRYLAESRVSTSQQMENIWQERYDAAAAGKIVVDSTGNRHEVREQPDGTKIYVSYDESGREITSPTPPANVMSLADIRAEAKKIGQEIVMNQEDLARAELALGLRREVMEKTQGYIDTLKKQIEDLERLNTTDLETIKTAEAEAAARQQAINALTEPDFIARVQNGQATYGEIQQYVQMNQAARENPSLKAILEQGENAPGLAQPTEYERLTGLVDDRRETIEDHQQALAQITQDMEYLATHEDVSIEEMREEFANDQFWNDFAQDNPEYGLEQKDIVQVADAAIDDSWYTQVTNWFSSTADGAVQMASDAINSVTGGGTPTDTSPATATTTASLSGTDGQGIQAGINLKSSFGAAHDAQAPATQTAEMNIKPDVSIMVPRSGMSAGAPMMG